MAVAPTPADRRQDPREGASEAVKLITVGRHAFEAEVVDRSLRGLRVRLADAAALPTEVTVLSRATGSAHLARVVWRTSPYVGLSLLKTIEMRTASGVEAEELRKLWREHISG